MVQPTSRSSDPINAAPVPDGIPVRESAAALHDAVLRGDLKTIDQLLQSRPELARLPDSDGNTPLHRAVLAGADPRAIERLLEFGADPTQPNGEGDTALHLAFGRHVPVPGLVDALLWHLDRHRGGRLVPTLTHRNADLKTPAMLGAESDAKLYGPMLADMVVEYLGWLRDSGNDALAEVASRGDTEALAPWLARPDALTLPLSPMGHGALAIAAGRGQLDVMRMLLATSDGKRRYPVDLPAFPGGETPLARAAAFGQREAVALLLANGADADGPDIDGRTPLMHAAVYGHVDVVEQLIAGGADLDAQQLQGWTALSYATAAHQAPAAVALLEHGADSVINARDIFGRTPLLLAVAADELAVSPEAHQNLIAMLIAYGADVDIEDESGTTPLMLAARAGDTATVRQLCDEAADVHRRDAKGRTAAMIARGAGHVELAAMLARAESQDR